MRRFRAGFNNGAGSLPMYDGTRLCNRQRGAVVVAINYRLGALGFLLATGGAVTPLPSRLFCMENRE